MIERYKYILYLYKLFYLSSKRSLAKIISVNMKYQKVIQLTFTIEKKTTINISNLDIINIYALNFIDVSFAMYECHRSNDKIALFTQYF